MSNTISRLNEALTGRYVVERQIGEGGMTTVYLARDARHDRPVALKVLKPALEVAIGGRRFLDEIQTTARLQHPHILPLFDSGQAGGFLYYVMPFVEDETLRSRLDREGPLGVDEAVRITRSVAAALDYAHRQKRIHRDIKPSNILLHDGNALVADFGIALALDAAGSGRHTSTGISIGTPRYMSPEQAAADRVLTPASDVYSLGAVLYEMLAGEPPHAGRTPQETLARIMTTGPQPLSMLRPSVPPHVESVVARALEKLPADRFRTAAGLSDALGDPDFRHTTTAVPARPEAVSAARPIARPRGMRVVPWAIAAAAVLVAVISMLSPDREPLMGIPTRVALIEGGAGPIDGRELAISPDGRWIAASGRSESGAQVLFIRRVDETEWRPLPNSENAEQPTFSPDGEWLAFATVGVRGVFKVPRSGGRPSGSETSARTSLTGARAMSS